MSTQTKQRPPTSDSQVTEEGLLIYTADQPVVETIPGDCKLFVDMVDKGFSFPGFEKLKVSKLELEKPRSFRQIFESKYKDIKDPAPVSDTILLVIFLYLIFGGIYPTVLWLDPSVSKSELSVVTVFVCLIALVGFWFLIRDKTFRDEVFLCPRVIKERWNESEWVERLNKIHLQSAKRDPVTEKELMDYLMNVFSSQQDGKTITELKQYKEELEMKRNEVQKRKEGPQKRVSNEVKEAYVNQIASVKKSAETKITEIQNVINRIDDFIDDVKEEIETWVNELFPHYEDNQYYAEWIEESMEVLSATDETISEIELKLTEAEQRFLDKTEALSKLLADANQYRMSLAEVKENNYNDLRKLRV